MEHNHSHSHHHAHGGDISHVGRAFWLGILLNALFVLVEFAAGFYSNSLALLSDAGHNLSDVVSLGLALLAYRMAKAASTEHFTYGYNRLTILVSLTNAVILLIAVGSIGWEAIQRFSHPEPSLGLTTALVAGAGIVINTISALLFFRDKEKDLNAKGAYLHLATDALVSAAVVIGGVLIYYTGLSWIDPLLSLLIMGVVVYSTWGLLRESFYLSMDAVPANVNTGLVRQKVIQQQGIKNMHHLHIWALSTTRNAMTAHLVVDNTLSQDELNQLKERVRHDLEHLNIHHITFEVEQENCDESCKID